ncbi:MAG: class I SAM-dependent methyltransferase [Actinomycetota bacterium]|nr:class I SAM-dependent methyltransferase [Actinomycetota bacterium]
MSTAGDYDEVPYSKYPYPHTHPDRLATVATLHGLHPAPPAGCRVLELGCGAGGNLIPLAYAAPELRAVGVDLAASAIADGRATAAALELANVELLEGDLRDLGGGELGAFDYVVAHGVYAWVEADVRDALLAAIHAHLAPEGVGFVSYNALPGGYMRRMIREMGLWHARAATDPLERARTAQGLFRFLAEHRVADDPYGSVLGRELRRVVARPLRTLVHDDLAGATIAVWFSDFAAHAASHGLGFVGETELAELEDDRLPPGVEDAVRELGGEDRVVFEQYSDFLLGRKFRQTVLCHAERPVDEALAPERMVDLRFLSSAVPDSAAPAGLQSRAIEALEAVWPATLGFEELRNGLGADTHELARALLHGFRSGVVEPHVDPPRWATLPGERPRASMLARLQAADAIDVTTLRHENVRMEEPAARRLLRLLDGTHDREAILAELARGEDGVALAAEDLERNLEALAGLALLHA